MIDEVKAAKDLEEAMKEAEIKSQKDQKMKSVKQIKHEERMAD